MQLQSMKPPKDIEMKFQFTPEKIMMQLSKDKLQKLEEIWNEYPDGLGLTVFAQLMLDAVDCKDEEKYELLHGALKLFSEIDINGDQSMEWSEFMQYMIDAVGLTNIPTSDSGAGTETITEIIEQKKANLFKRFYLTKKPLDRSNHSNYILNAKYCRKANNLVYFFEKQTRDVKFYNLQFQTYERFKVPCKGKEYVLTDVAYSESMLTFGCTCTDSNMYFWNYKDNKLKYLKQVNTPLPQNRMWYLNQHEVWITSGRDYLLRTWDIYKDKQQLSSIHLHNDEIMDVCEIESPLCIASCSLDTKIVLYSLVDSQTLRVIEGDHRRGVRRLSYSSLSGGYLISIGYEVFANVWAPESIVSDNLLGKLKGHTKSIIDTKFIGKTPFNATIDEGNVIRIWDIKSFSCMQVIASKIQTVVQCLLSLNDNVLWVCGKKFIQFDTFTVDESGTGQVHHSAGKVAKREAFPIHAEINTHYLQVVVANKNDVKIFDCSNGKLIKIHDNVTDQIEGSEITQFRHDMRHRKCYVGDTFGHIKIYNISSGICLKDVSEDKLIEAPDYCSSKGSEESEQSDEELQMQSKEAGAVMGEITGLNLIWEEGYILMVCSDSKHYYVYDEEDTESSELLRTVTGGHKEEISILKYSDHLSLVATGSIDGEIVIWDFELSKIEAMLHGHTSDITGIEFVVPYPMMITCSMDCTLCIWGVRPAPLALRYICLNRFINISWSFKSDIEAPISQIVVDLRVQRGIRKHQRISNSIMHATKHGKFNLNLFLTSIEMKVKQEIVRGLENKEDLMTSSGLSLNQTLITELSQGAQGQQNQRPNVSKDLQSQIEKERLHLYLSDEQGYVKIWDFTAVLEYSGLRKCDNYKTKRQNFNPKRKEYVNVSVMARSMRKDALSNLRLPEVINPLESGIFVREVRGHQDCIVSMTPIKQELGGVVTCSLDNKVKLWSRELDIWGTLDQSDKNVEKLDKRWCFPREARFLQKTSEIHQVQDLVLGLGDVLDITNTNLVFIENEPNLPIIIEKQTKVALKSNVPKIKELIQQNKDQQKEARVNIAQLIEDYRNKLSNDSLHEKTIMKLERDLKDYDVELSKLAKNQNQEVSKKQYHGYPKYLESELDSSILKRRMDQTPYSNRQELINNAILEVDNDLGEYFTGRTTKQGQIPISKTGGVMTRGANHFDLLQQLQRSRSNSKSRIGETLENDRSCLFQLQDVPMIRDKIQSLNSYKSKRMYATPMKPRPDYPMLEKHPSSTSTNQRLQLPSIILYNTAVTPSEKYTSSKSVERIHSQMPNSYKLPLTLSRNPSVSRNYRGIDIRSRNKTMLEQAESQPYIMISGAPSNSTLTVHEQHQTQVRPPYRANRQSPFIIQEQDSSRMIGAPYIITDDRSQESDERPLLQSEFQRIKSKYFGEHSAVSLIVKEESKKLKEQRIALNVTRSSRMETTVRRRNL